MGQLDGRAALVVGGGSAFGRAVAVALAQAGAGVMVGCGDEAQGCAAVAAVAEAGRAAQHVLLDPTDPEQCARAVAATIDALGRIDVLVTRVVSPPRQRRLLHEIDESAWDDATRHVVLAAALPVWHAQRAMKRQGGGSIVVVGSSAALVGVPGLAAFSATAGALVNFTRSTAVDGHRAGVPVRVNCLSLGLDAPRWEEVAPTVVFLASDQSKHVNGQIVAADDGLTAWRD